MENRDDRGPKQRWQRTKKYGGPYEEKINKWKTKLGLENSEGS
jgi:hypothetical protein